MPVLKLDISGLPDRWISVEDAACHYASGSVAYTLGAVMTTLHGGRNGQGDVSTLEVHPIIAAQGRSAAARLLRSAPRLTRLNHKLFKRDRYTCAYCAGVFRAEALEREHIVPVSRGGTDTWMNLVAACHACNARKGARTPEEAKMPLVYLPYTPTRWEDMILQARSEHIVADQMDFLAANLPKGSRLA